MTLSKIGLVRELLFGSLIPEYASSDNDFRDAVAVVATPFNGWYRGGKPDKTNWAIAIVAERYAKAFNLPFAGQPEHISFLREWGVPILAEFPNDNGKGVESQLLAAFQAKHVLPLGTKVIRIGMPEHLGRCVALDRYYGLDSVVPKECQRIPYDSSKRPGAQWWCKNREIFELYERFYARPGTAAKLFLGMLPPS